LFIADECEIRHLFSIFFPAGRQGNMGFARDQRVVNKPETLQGVFYNEWSTLENRMGTESDLTGRFQ